MRFEERNTGVDDAQLDEALRNFRQSVHGWSEEEFSKPRVVRRSRWDAMWRVVASPVMAWTMACSLLMASVGVPLSVHHLHQVAIQQQMAVEKQKSIEQQQAAEQAAALNDDELLSHVDSDVAQAAPDAMQPLASLMSDTASTNTAQ